jgi:phage-related holin
MTEWEAVAINLAGWVSLGVILEYFGMTQETLIILTSMLLLDRIFWVVNAYIQETLESKLMVTGLVKKLTRWMLPFIVIAIIRGSGFENVDLIANIILGILIVAEGYSVIWHIYSINYKKQLEEIDALKLLMEWIARLLKSKIDETLPPKNEDEWKKGEGESTES